MGQYCSTHDGAHPPTTCVHVSTKGMSTWQATVPATASTAIHCHTSSKAIQSAMYCNHCHTLTAIQAAMQVQAVAGETCTLEEVTTLDRLPQQLATYTIHTSSRVVHSPGRPKNANSCVSSEPLRLGPGACVSLVTQPGVVVPPQESRSEAFQCSCDPSAYPWPS